MNTIDQAPGEPSQRPKLEASYVLPIAASVSQARRLSGYLLRLSRQIDDVLVVDGSPEPVFAQHAGAWGKHVRHIRPAFQTANGKVGGVITGVRQARHERVIIADDDVRYRQAELQRMLYLLDRCEVVRPQNWFCPLPWHARWDTARTLLNRLFGGDWPGTLGVRRSCFLKAGAYSGEVLFENLELVRTIEAAGGREAVALDLFLVRRPSSAKHFFSQRVRQAYDEFSRPARFAAQLSLLPLGMVLAWWNPVLLVLPFGSAVAAAEGGRRRAEGREVFPASSALWAPAWLAERAITSWLALANRILFGGVRYRSGRLKLAATPRRVLERRLGERGAQPEGTVIDSSAA